MEHNIFNGTLHTDNIIIIVSKMMGARSRMADIPSQNIYNTYFISFHDTSYTFVALLLAEMHDACPFPGLLWDNFSNIYHILGNAQHRYINIAWGVHFTERQTKYIAVALFLQLLQVTFSFE